VRGQGGPGGGAGGVGGRGGRGWVGTGGGPRARPSTEFSQVGLRGTHRTRSAGRLPPPKQGMTPPMIVAGLAAGDQMGVTVEPTGGAPSPSAPPALMLAPPPGRAPPPSPPGPPGGGPPARPGAGNGP